MRKLVFGINLTIDGCCDHTKGIADDEVHTYFAQLMREADTLVYGRKTYELMVPYWPDMAKDPSGEPEATIEFAKAFDAVGEIVVFSKTLENVEGSKTRIVSADLEGEIRRLKQQAGKNILVGGVDIPAQLIELGLIDEFYFVVQPIIVGEGRRFLDSTSLPASLQLKLVESTIFKSGCVELRYVKER